MRVIFTLFLHAIVIIREPEFTRERWSEMLKQWKLDPSLPLREAC